MLRLPRSSGLSFRCLLDLCSLLRDLEGDLETDPEDMRSCFRFRGGERAGERVTRWTCRDVTMSSPFSLVRLRDLERDRFVDMVETESSDPDDIERDLSRPGGDIDLGLNEDGRLPSALALSASALANCSSAMPVLRSRSLVTSLASLGASLGFSSCCVRDGLET